MASLPRVLPQPLQRVVHGVYRRARGHRRALDQDDRAAEVACRVQLGPSAAATGVFGHDPLDAVPLQQRQVTRHGERAALDHHVPLRWRQGQATVDHAQQPPVLRGVLQKGLDVLAADGQKNALGLAGQGRGCARHVRHPYPAVARLGLPWGALQGKQGRASGGAGLDRVQAHLHGKGVCGVDDVCDAFAVYEGAQPCHAAKATDAGGQGLRQRVGGTAGVREDGIDLGGGQGLRQLAGLAGTAQQENAWHG